jgi:hypothetical protein
VWLDCAFHAGTGSIAAKVRSCMTTALGIVGAFVATSPATFGVTVVL